MSRKIFVAALAAFTAFFTPAIAHAATWTDGDGNVWTYNGGKVTAVTIERTTLSIPATLGGNAVTSFGATVFKGNSRAVRVTIPATVTAIPASAFEGCENLKAVTIQGEGLTSIGYRAFAGCGNLEAFAMPNSVTSLGQGVFSGCSSMESVTLSDGLTELTGVGFGGTDPVAAGSNDSRYFDYSSGTRLYAAYYNAMFYNCTSLKTINWGAGIKTIGNIAFLNCSALEKVEIPDAVTNIGYHAFLGCSNLGKVKIGNGVTTVRRAAFRALPNLTKVTFGAKVNSIGSQTFEDCVNLQNFILPDTIQHLNYRCFAGCNKALTSVTIPTNKDERETEFGEGVFSGCTKLATVTFGDTVKTLSGVDFGGTDPVAAGSNDSRYFDYSSGTRLYAAYYNAMFYNCTSLKTINWGKNIKTIGNIAFLNCSALEKVEIPDTVTEIGYHAFLGCSNLGDVKIGNGVTAVRRATFRALPNLTKVTFGAKVNSIGSQTFEDCVNLQNFTLPDTIQHLNYRCFAGCNKALTSVTIPTNRDELNTEMGQGVFSGCTKLATVTFGDTVKELPGVGFGGTDPMGAGSNNSNYFDYSSGTRLYAAYYNALFYNCTSLKTINWGAGIKTIGNIAFLNCSSLTDLVLPANITEIGNHAFFGCSSLKTVTVEGNVNSIGRYAFGNCPALHYADFRGAKMTSAPGYMPFAFDRERTTIYAAKGSTGWTGVADVGGLPPSGAWGGARITYAPPPANAGNPYDFYVYPSLGLDNTPWSLMVTTNRYVHGRTVPLSAATIREGDTIYLSYAWDEYWRGEAFDVTNRFTLSGVKTSSFDDSASFDADSTFGYLWTTNAVPYALQNLAPGKYTLTLALNAGNRLKETDYTNNSTSITFTVVGTPKFTVRFNANGGSVSESSRTVYDGRTIGKLPVPAKSGSIFAGWYAGDVKITENTVVSSNMTCTAKWQSYDIVFWKPLDMSWKETMFVNSSSYANGMQSTFQVGDPIYFYYSCYEAGAQTMRTAFVNRFKLVGDNGVSKDLHHNIYGIYSGTCEGVYGTKVGALQGLAAGTYKFTCTLDADKAVVESNEGNNTKTIEFTVVPAGEQLCTVVFNANGGSGGATRSVKSGGAIGTLPSATRSGYSFAGWYTASSGGNRITASTVVTANVVYYAHWTVVPPPPPPPGPEGAVPLAAASEYNGYLYDTAGKVKGTIQVKVAKPNAKTGLAAVKATLQLTGQKKLTLKAADGGKAKLVNNGPTVVALSGGEACKVMLGENGIAGYYGKLYIDGARNFFASKDKAEQNAANAAFAKLPGAINVKFGGGTASLMKAKKGKIKAAVVLDNGTKESVNAMILAGENGWCIPVVAPKKAKVAFAVWIAPDGAISVAGMAGAIAGRVRTPARSLAFAIDGGVKAWAKAGLPGETAFLPDGFVFEGGDKWKFDKADAIKYKNGAFETVKDNGNPSGLKLTYKAKDGSFKGSFKAYAIVQGKLKKQTVNVTGVMIDGKGYGSATIKKTGSVAVTIE